MSAIPHPPRRGSRLRRFANNLAEFSARSFLVYLLFRWIVTDFVPAFIWAANKIVEVALDHF